MHLLNDVIMAACELCSDTEIRIYRNESGDQITLSINNEWRNSPDKWGYHTREIPPSHEILARCSVNSLKLRVPRSIVLLITPDYINKNFDTKNKERSKWR